MKKLMIIMMLGMFCLTSFAQRGSGQNTVVDKSLSYTDTWFEYPGIVTDTIGAADSTWTFTVGNLTDRKVYFNLRFDLDSIGGTAAPVSIYIKKKVHDYASFTDTDTITWSGDVDTVFNYETATYHTADFWQVKLVGTNNAFKAKVGRLSGKFIKQ